MLFLVVDLSFYFIYFQFEKTMSAKTRVRQWESHHLRWAVIPPLSIISGTGAAIYTAVVV
jgi:hypothetical protein